VHSEESTGSICVLRHGQLPLIDHQPRRGEETEFPPAKTMPYMERTVAERSKARLKDQFAATPASFASGSLL
jgi:hypothetical protein